MNIMHYQNREWTTFNWPMPVDFNISGTQQNITEKNNKLKILFSSVAILFPKQLPRLELGAGYLPDDDLGLENN